MLLTPDIYSTNVKSSGHANISLSYVLGLHIIVVGVKYTFGEYIALVDFQGVQGKVNSRSFQVRDMMSMSET